MSNSYLISENFLSKDVLAHQLIKLTSNAIFLTTFCKESTLTDAIFYSIKVIYDSAAMSINNIS